MYDKLRKITPILYICLRTLKSFLHAISGFKADLKQEVDVQCIRQLNHGPILVT